MGNRALLNRLNQIEELNGLIKDLESQIDTLKDQIKADMVAKEIEELEVGDYKVRYQKIESNRFDTTSFKKAYKSLYDEFTKTTTSMRFSIN